MVFILLLRISCVDIADPLLTVYNGLYLPFSVLAFFYLGECWVFKNNKIIQFTEESCQGYILILKVLRRVVLFSEIITS